MDLANAVSKTKAYAGYFNYPLSEEETHHWLISKRPVSKTSISKLLSPLEAKELTYKKNLLKNTQKKEKLAQELLKIARFIPFIRLIALTGSVAANNSKKNDDLDLLIITEENTLWLVRPLFLLLLSCQFSRRHPGDSSQKVSNAFCPNLWLDTSSLKIPTKRQSLYTAHEVLQVKPLLDRGQTHLRFVKANSWTKRFLANAYDSFSKINLPDTQNHFYAFLLFPLNYLLFVLQYLYMLPKKTTETVTLHSAFFHKNNLSNTLINHLKNNSL